MKRATVAAGIGLAALLGTEIGLLLRAQTGVGAKRANAAIVQVERDPNEVTPRVTTALPEQNLDEEQLRSDEDGRLERTSVDPVVREGLRFPPPPSRVMPGYVREFAQIGPENQPRLAPSPSAPSKTLPEIRP
jgi:hypothetical protein